MRNILRVIGGIIEDVPRTETEFHVSLQSIQTSAKYASPELAQMNWERLTEIINDFIPAPPTPLKHWQQNVVDTFTGAKG